MISTDCYVKALSDVFQARVKYFMQKVARVVLNENPEIESHDKRCDFAKKILSGEASIFEYTLGVTTVPAIAEIITNLGEPDAQQIEQAVRSIFSDFAGVATT